MVDNSVPSPRRTLILGLVFWCAFSIVAVCLRGVRWDETYEHALAITRTAPYPEGHPFYIYLRNVFSLQSYLSAGLLWLTHSPLLVNFLRNVVQLIFLTVPIYLFAVTLTRKAIWGHMAVVLALCSVYQFFASHYAIETWPFYFSVGQIGAGYALLVLCAFMADWRRTAWFLLGLLFAVHIGQLPPLFLFVGLVLFTTQKAQQKEELWRGIRWGGLGFLCSVLFLIVLRQFHVSYPTEGPYFAEGDTNNIWIEYSTRHDIHRFVEFMHPFSHSILVIALVFIGGCLAWFSRQENDSQKHHIRDIVFYAWCVGAIALGVRAVHGLLGKDIPFLIIGWMPYRVPNHLAPILLGLALMLLARGVVSAPDSRRYSSSCWLIILSVISLPVALAGSFIPEAIYLRYIEQGEYICFFLVGGALAVVAEELWNTARNRGSAWGLVILASTISLLVFNQFAGACLLAGVVTHFILARVGSSRFPSEKVLSTFAVSSVVCLLAILMATEWRHREHLPMTAFQTGAAEYLEQAGDLDELIITPNWEVEWSARLGVPIFADYQTPHLVTYIPRLGPALRKMHAEVFGFDMDGTAGLELADMEALTPAQWQALGDRYQFSYLIHPAEHPIKLEVVYTADGMNLYAIPRRD
jgi:hypothetical protein